MGTPEPAPALSHIGANGEVTMVDVSRKEISIREARATGRIVLAAETLRLIEQNQIAKGNVLATARIAGIQAAKRTAELIPLCHQLNLEHIQLDFDQAPDGISIIATVRTIGRTGAEMEALTAVSVAALTIYDMCKAVDKSMVIDAVRLMEKTKRLPR